MPRIISGTWRRRALESPPDKEVTRPYPDRVKESVFNLLRGWWEGARILDLYAGVGTIGLEAASRGAAEVVMVERDTRIAAMLERNVEMLGAGDVARIVRGDALGESVLLRAPQPCDLVFVDPPYPVMRDEGSRTRVLAHVDRLADVLRPGGFLLLRTPLDPDETDHAVARLDGPEVHRYARDMFVLLYQRPESDA